MITEAINEALRWHRQTRSEMGQVDRLYLGRKQHDELRCAAQPFIGKVTAADITDEARRMEYCGMKVYRVDAESFIGFGHDDPSPAG